MKTKVLKSLILIGIFFLVAGCDSEVPNLQGEWMAVDKKTPYKVVITDNIFQIQIYQVENTTDSNPKELAPVVEDAAEETASMLLTDLSYLPNPVQTDLQVHYTLVQDATVYMHMHNALGMPMYSTSARTESAGEHMVQINMNGWMQGEYTLYIHADDQLVQQVVIKK